mmetsp:Transcript_56236/g.150216  ORF Transcript_56236/g.150216 Transcript_56236/m.150216 type:complete len:237 (-) Transcript_56236:462-1172(-)
MFPFSSFCLRARHLHLSSSCRRGALSGRLGRSVYVHLSTVFLLSNFPTIWFSMLSSSVRRGAFLRRLGRSVYIHLSIAFLLSNIIIIWFSIFITDHSDRIPVTFAVALRFPVSLTKGRLTSHQPCRRFPTRWWILLPVSASSRARQTTNTIDKFVDRSVLVDCVGLYSHFAVCTHLCCFVLNCVLFGDIVLLLVLYIGHFLVPRRLFLKVNCSACLVLLLPNTFLAVRFALLSRWL